MNKSSDTPCPTTQPRSARETGRAEAKSTASIRRIHARQRRSGGKSARSRSSPVKTDPRDGHAGLGSRQGETVAQQALRHLLPGQHKMQMGQRRP